MVPFNPDDGSFPSALEALFARPAATVPVLLLVAGAAARRGGWAERAAIGLAGAWSERGARVVLADLDVQEPGLHRRLGVEDGEGLADMLEFGVSLRRGARTVPDHAFRLITPGIYVPDAAELLGHPRWERLIARFAEDQTTLLAYVPAGTPGLIALARRVGKAVLLAGVDEMDAVAAALPSECAVDTILCRPDAATESATGREASDPDATEWGETPAGVDPATGGPVLEDASLEDERTLQEPTFVQRSFRRQRRVSPVLWALLVVALAAGGWVAVQRYQDALQPAAAVATEPTTSGPAGPPAQPPEPVDVPAPYSVAVEAHPDYTIARDRVATLRRSESDIGFYLAPVVVDSVIYYRVLAGPAPDSTAAVELMRQLVRQGHKTDADAWAVRPTLWAFHLGDFDSRQAAQRRGAALDQQGVPTYTLELPYTGGASRYRLYAGAYENPGQAEIMAQFLESVGVDASLVRRTGRHGA